MKKETLVIRPEKTKRRIGVLPTYAQRDRTKYTRKAKHRGRECPPEFPRKPWVFRGNSGLGIVEVSGAW